MIYKKEFSKNLLSSIGLVYEGAPNYTTSYTVSGDLNNDGISFNDLMFVPKDASQIKLVTVPKSNDNRDQATLWNQLNTFIENNPYLSTRRGQFAERNAYVLPWTHKLDLNFTQDIRFTTGKDKHTIRLTADIYNFSNLLNKDWGVFYVPTTTQPLVFQRIDTDGRTPIYRFPFLDPTKQIPQSRPYTPSPGLGSRWQLQIGVRYLFN
jgi:hypothetical protein